MNHRWRLALLAALLMTLGAGRVQAETAKYLKPAKLSAAVNQENLYYLTDRDYKSIWYAKRGYLRLDLPEEESAHGLYICFHKKVVPLVVEVPDAQGGYRTLTRVGGEYLHQWVALPGVSSVRLRIADESKKEMLELAEVRLLGAGDLPPEIQRWRTAEKADLMLLSAHPDDELLWFGGALPVYAGERGLRVQVVYLAHGDSWRMNELLDGLWLCGVRDYPIIGEFKDVHPAARDGVYSAWGGTKTVYPWFVSILRRLRPEVLLTQDFDGEYGHAAHQVAAYMAANCPPKAADPAYDAASCAAYGTWQVKKVYIHLYPENRIVMDWEQPLSAFGGRTGLEMANLALECHKSQQPIGFSAKTGGPYDCRLFGLYATAVGPDRLKNDFFENIVMEPAPR